MFDRVIEDEFVLTEKACVAFMKQIIQGVEFMQHLTMHHPIQERHRTSIQSSKQERTVSKLELFDQWNSRTVF